MSSLEAQAFGAWSPATFAIATKDGGRAERKGHVKGPLAIARDGRSKPVLWAVTHLPTGCRICLLEGTAATAKRICDDLIAAVDFAFEDRSEMLQPDRLRAFCSTLLEHAGHVHSPGAAKLLKGAA